MEKKLALMAIAVVLSVTGFGLFWYATSWVAALGLFLAMWANNFRHVGGE